MSDSHVGKYINELIFVRKLSKNSIIAYKQDILLLKDWLAARNCSLLDAPQEILRSFVHARSKLGEHTSTLNRRISSIHGYYSYLMRQSIISHNPSVSLHNFKIQKHLPPLLHADQLKNLLNFPIETFLDRRDQVLYEFLYSTGCRISECLSLDHIEVRGTKKISIKGKGDKTRVVFITNILQEKLAVYLEERSAYLRSRGEEEAHALFINYKGNRLTRMGAAYTLSRRLRTLGISSATLHSFRHSFATDLLDNGLDVRIVQELMGHSSVSTTQRYTHLSRKSIIEMYNRTHPRAHK